MSRQIQADLLALCQVSEEDAELFIKWMFEQKKATNFDFKTLTYPRACMACVHEENETVAMVPLHPVLQLESLAHKEGLSDAALILALRAVDEQVTQAMQNTGMCEVFFQTSNARFAETCSRHGWIKDLYDPVKGTWLMKKQRTWQMPEGNG